MARRFRWVTRTVLGLVLVVVVLIGYVYVASSLKLSKRYAVNPPRVNVANDSASIARGKYLAEHVALCSDCHGADLGGRVLVDNFAIGRFVAPNLTRGRGGIGREYSDEDLVRAVLYGVRRDGRSLTMMPVGSYTADDLGAIIAYVRSVPAIDRELPSVSPGPVARALGLLGQFPLASAASVDHERVTVAPAPETADAVRAGKQLVTMAGCASCHGPELAGGLGPPPGSANITPVGIGEWTEKDFITALREARRPDGTRIGDMMPRAYGQMSDADLRNIFSYLKSLPPRGVKTANQQRGEDQ